MSQLTQSQYHAIFLMSTGSTAASAARAVGVHRNTICNWQRSEIFRDALAQARTEQTQSWRAQAAARATQAFEANPALCLAAAKAMVNASPHKPSRNDPCPCGSGKKYKRCCRPD
jgi:uncharacterized protein YchJ